MRDCSSGAEGGNTGSCPRTSQYESHPKVSEISQNSGKMKRPSKANWNTGKSKVKQ